ncbi:hypothetical protein [Phascolarctobacterium succinatutens]|uniref:hypothetical protein n=1 Tax=Phascolarctobacterium succinatutens TaxID=626940 RepID=UPI0026F323A3|nr:hypothetical protein [Phascolarctobacterium succinatutens]
MKSLTKVLMMALTLTAMLFSTACYAQTGEATSFKDRLQNIQENDGKQLKFAFYLDSEGHANFEQKVLDEIVASLQAKVPSYVTIQGDGQFLADLDLYRETKYDDLMAEMQEKNPQFAVLGDYAESGRKVKLTKPILDEFFQNNKYDGLVLARIDVAQVKNSYNIWVGGIDTKAELDVTFRVFNKHSKAGYVFNNRQRVVGKSHAMMNTSEDRAARKAIPKALEKIQTIKVE